LNENTPKLRVSAVILAAGTSSRMGAPKQLLPTGPSAQAPGTEPKTGEPPAAEAAETLLGRVVENVRRSHVTEIVVVLGHAAEEIRQRVPLEGARVVVNENYRLGMGTSLRTGLRAVDPQAEAALIVLADQPFIRPATLDRLIEDYEAKKPQRVPRGDAAPG
jgi:molybdenum cofactor cytidylyltransferase